MNDDHPLDASDLGQVVLHLRYLRADLGKVSTQVTNLSSQMATRGELESLRTELNIKLDDLRREVHDQSAGSTFERTVSLVTKVGSALIVLSTLFGGLYVFVHFIDRVPAAQKATP